MLVKCVVACRYSSGRPALFPCLIELTKAQYYNGDHYNGARYAADHQHYEVSDNHIVFDEHDGPEWLFNNLFPSDKTVTFVSIDPSSYD